MLLSACATVPSAHDEGGPAWFSAEGPHVLVETDLDADDAKNLLRALERWRQAITIAAFPRARPPQKKLEVVVLRNGELSVLLPDVRGYFTRSQGSHPFLLLGARTTWNRSAVMKHELTHAVIDENLPGAPNWLNEGLATVLQTADIDEKTGKVSWGALPVGPEGYTRHPTSPLAVVLDDREWTRERMGRLEYSSQFLVRMLLRVHRERFSCLVEHLNSGDGLVASRRACFGGHDDWDREYAAEYLEIGGGAFGSASLDPHASEPDGPGADAQRMADADVHDVLARVNHVAAGYFHGDDPRRERLLAASDHHLDLSLRGAETSGHGHAPGPRPGDEGGPAWFEATAEHVVVVTDVDAYAGQALAPRLQNLRQAMRAALLPDARFPDQDLGVVLLRDGELEALGPRVSSLFADEWLLGPFLVLEAHDATGATPNLLQELARVVVAEDLPAAPSWLAAGLAARLEAVRLDEANGDVWLRLENPGGAHVPLDELFKPWPSERRLALQAASGRLLRTLEARHRTEVDCLVDRLVNLEGYDQALDRCWPRRDDWPRDDTEVVNAVVPPRKVARIVPAAPTAPVRQLLNADTHAWLALVDLLASAKVAREAQGQLVAASRQHQRRALALDATQILAASMSLRDARDPLTGAARNDLVDRLIAKHPGDWRAWIHRGNVVVSDDIPLPVAVKAARQRAAALAPRRPEVLLLEASAACADKDWATCETQALHAATQPLFGTYLATLHLEAVEQQGRCDDARTLLSKDASLAKAVSERIRDDIWYDDGHPLHCLDAAEHKGTGGLRPVMRLFAPPPPPSESNRQ